MAQFYYGLNVNFSFSEIQDEFLALENMGLRLADLSLISGTFDEGVTAGDIITLSGADFDIKKTYDSVSIAMAKYLVLMNGIETTTETINSNVVVDDQFLARAIKYDYYDYYNDIVRSADISTSRISSWSSFDDFDVTAPIFYKGDLEITPNPNQTDVNGDPISVLDVTSLATTVEPQLKRFDAEVPTHLVSLNVNGTIEKFLAMRGIPMKFKVVAETITTNNLNHTVTNGAADPAPTWTIYNLDDNIFLPFENVQNTGGLGISYFGNGSASLQLEFFNDPRKIQLLKLKNLNMFEFSRTQATGLRNLDISNNQLIELPDLNYISPGLEILDCTSNPFTRSTRTAAQQLSRLPGTIERITMNNCFSDNSTIDLSKNYLNDDLTALQRVQFRGNQPSTRMFSLGPTPKIYVDPTTQENTSLTDYDVRFQQYRYLDESVMKAKNLENIYIESITQSTSTNRNIKAGWDGSQEIDITLAAAGDGGTDTGRLKTFYSRRNNHNLVVVSGCQSITSYTHQYLQTLRGSSSVQGVFSGCGSLNTINLSSNPVTGDVSLAFQNLPSLSSLNLYNTKLSGVLGGQTFSGTGNLRSLTISSSQLGDGVNSFFDSLVFAQTASINSLNVYGNSNMVGSLPNFNSNKSLSSITISNTNITGGLTNLAEMPSLSWCNLGNNDLTGSAPAFNNSRVGYLYLYNNNLSGGLPSPSLPNIRYFQLQNNNFTGSLPSFATCPRLYYCHLASNNFSSYSAGSISSNTSLRYYYVNNNNLTVDAGAAIINDIYQIHLNTTNTWNRRFDMSNNGFSLNDLLNFSTTVQEQYNVLTQIRRWTIRV